MSRLPLTRAQALAWDTDWSDSDRELIAQHFDRLDTRTFYTPPSNSYVGCINANGTVVMTLHSGYLEFKRGYGPPDLPPGEWEGLGLSTFRPHSSPADRRPLSREQALKWNPKWSYSDRELIEQHLDRVDARAFYTPPSNSYVGCVNADGAVVMTLHAGYLEFSRHSAPAELADAEWAGMTLSTFQPHNSPTPEPREDNPPVCPIHHIALPSSGICDECQ